MSGCSYRRRRMWRSTRPKQLADKHFQGDRCVSRRGAGRYWRGAGESGGGDEGDRWKDKMHVEEAAKNHCEMIHVAGSRRCAAAAKCVYLLVCVCVCVSRVRRPDVLHTELLRADRNVHSCDSSARTNTSPLARPKYLRHDNQVQLTRCKYAALSKCQI